MVGKTRHAMQPLETAHPDTPQLRRFDDLYRGEFAFVWSAARHLGAPSGAVADVVQDVFLIAYRRLEQLHYEVSPRAWLFGVTRRVTFRYRRGAARSARRNAAFAEFAQPAARAPQQRHDDAEQLRGLLERLGDGTRVVWEMTEMLGMSAPEIASELELPLNTVYSRLRLARKQLLDLVADADRLEAWRDAARQQQAPPRGAEQRAWALLVPALGKGSAGTGIAAWMATQQAMAITLIAASAAVVGLVVTRPSPPAPPNQRPPASAPEVERAPAPMQPAPAPEAAPELARDMSSPPRRPPPVNDPAWLAEEITMLDRVQAQLGAGDVTAALATITEHERRFPAGALVDVREAARAEALCKSGDRAAAESVARRLVQRHPDSAVAQRYDNYFCRGDGSPGGPENRG